MNPHNDIAELEGLFEQIAGMAATSGSSSSSTCSVSIKVVGPLEDHSGTGNLDCVIQVFLSGCDPKYVSYSFNAVPTDPKPQNAAGTTDWNYQRDLSDNTVVNAGPLWYGSAPDNLCYGYAAPYDVTLTVTCPHGTCQSEPVHVKVTLPSFNDSAASFELDGAGPSGEVYTLSEPFAVPGISSWYKCFATVYGWKKRVTMQTDHISQYREGLA